MSRQILIVVVVTLLWLPACSTQSPVVPSKMSDAGDSMSTPPSPAASAEAGAQAAGQAVAGAYQLSFLNSSLQPVTTLTVGGPELVLGAHVQSDTGTPAQRGSVTFEYCAFRGLPPRDITRPDEAPSAACADGSARWKALGSVKVDGAGNGYLNFGFVQIPRTVGFRFRYAAQGGAISSGSSLPADFTWVAP